MLHKQYKTETQTEITESRRTVWPKSNEKKKSMVLKELNFYFYFQRKSKQTLTSNTTHFKEHGQIKNYIQCNYVNN